VEECHIQLIFLQRGYEGLGIRLSAEEAVPVADSELIAEYEILKQKSNAWNKYSHPGLVLIFAGLILPMLIINPGMNWLLLLISQSLEIPTQTMRYTGFVVGVVLWGLALLVLRQGAEYRLSYAERMFLRLYEAQLRMRTYLRTKIEKEKKSAYKRLSIIANEVDTQWRFPRSLGFFLDDTEICMFNYNLKRRLLPSVRAGQAKSITALTKINHFFLNPKAEPLEGLNAWMKDNLGDVAPLESSLTNSLVRILAPNKKHVAFGIFDMLVSGIYYALVANWLPITEDTALTTTVLIFAALLAGYVTLQKR
jgi:hypothetical protein